MSVASASVERLLSITSRYTHHLLRQRDHEDRTMDKRVLEWLDGDGPMPKDLILKLHNGTPGVEDFITPISKRINQLTPLEMVKLCSDHFPIDYSQPNNGWVEDFGDFLKDVYSIVKHRGG